jgi:hypothetical protein
MVKIDLPYLWAATGRHGRLYWFYRRNGQRIPITTPEGRRLGRGEAGFFEAYERIHKSFDVAPAVAPTLGTVAHLINVYRAAPEYATLKPKTKKDYGRYLDVLKEQHGHQQLATMPREAVFKLRDEFQETPRTANYVVSVLRLILSYAEPLSVYRPIGATRRGARRSSEQGRDIVHGRKSNARHIASIGRSGH